jgi:hypothetical protein
MDRAVSSILSLLRPPGHLYTTLAECSSRSSASVAAEDDGYLRCER